MGKAKNLKVNFKEFGGIDKIAIPIVSILETNKIRQRLW